MPSNIPRAGALSDQKNRWQICSSDTECVRALRWHFSLVWSGREMEIEQHGFRVHWSNECQRCGKTLTVPSSIDARLGSECNRKV